MLTLQIVPYAQIADLSSVGRIRKLLTIAKQDKIRFGDGHKFHANISNNRVCTVKRIRI